MAPPLHALLLAGFVLALSGCAAVSPSPSPASSPTPGTTEAPAPAARLPRPGDHWHATYEIRVCGEPQPPLPPFPGPIHNHGDAVIHIHPSSPQDAGAQINLARFFADAGGLLSNDALQLPGRTLLRNGDRCSDGRLGTVRIAVNGALPAAGAAYVPQDGDSILEQCLWKGH